MKVAAGDDARRFCWKEFRTQAGVGQNIEAFREVANRRGSEFVGLRHGAGGVVGAKPVTALQAGASGGAALWLTAGATRSFTSAEEYLGRAGPKSCTM